jgi:hypothetical protein
LLLEIHIDVKMHSILTEIQESCFLADDGAFQAHKPTALVNASFNKETI